MACTHTINGMYWRMIVFLEYIAGTKLGKCSEMRQFNFKYFTEQEFNDRFSNVSNDCFFGVFHLNIRSLNSNVRNLCQFLQLNLQFSIILSNQLNCFH